MLLIGLIALGLGVTFLILMNRQKEKNAKKLKGAGQLRSLQQQTTSALKEADPLQTAKIGAILSFSEVGLTSESFDAQVLARHLHKEGRDRWTELEADRGGSKVYLTISEGEDGTELSLSLSSIEFGDLPVEQPLEQLGAETAFSFEGTHYEFSDNGRAQFCAQENELNPEAYEYWEFEGEDEEQFISLTRWSDGSVEASYEVPVLSHAVTVYSE